MKQNGSSRDNQPITLKQKKTLIAAYQQTGNMTQAMREAGVRSPRTAYLWWHRYCESGEDGLQPHSHARNNQRHLPDSIVEQICQLRCQEPQWGRLRIADELAQYYGQQVVSPASVEAVLRRAGLWEHVAETAPRSAGIPPWLGGGIDYDSLLAIVQMGIRLSIHSEARAASQVLYQQVWAPLEANPTLSNRLLATPEIGSWLLSSRLHLGHSLMNSGHWSQAAHYLRETIAWMQEQEHAVGTHRRPWDWEDAPNFVSLRRDDVWLGCYQHLGLVLGKQDVKAGLAYLQTALNGIRRSHRPIVPGDQTTIGSLERDLANLKLRLRHFSEAEVRQHLLHAQQNAENSGVPGVQAYTHITQARLHDRLARAASEREKGVRRQQRESMQQSIEQALQLVEQEQEDHDRPMRQTMCFVDTALLAQTHGMPVDGRRLQRAVQNCLTCGYGHQAEKLLVMPDIHIWLPEDALRNLTNLLQEENNLEYAE